MKRLLPLLLPLLAATAFAQGPLAPPNTSGPQIGPVAALDGSGNPRPTMKTLHQVEPRTAVQTLAVSAPYTISHPGSYYLTGNITVDSGDAIIIASDDVSLDLNGFTIRSTLVGSISGAGVSIPANHARLSVRNGSIVSGTIVPNTGSPSVAGFNFAIGGSALLIESIVSDVKVSGTNYGIALDEQGIVERCVVSHCSGNGISADIIRDCVATDCYTHAIFAGQNVSNSTGKSKTSTAIWCHGNATNCAGTSVSGGGLYCDGNVTNCTGFSSTGDGLKCGGNATNCTGYSFSTTGYGLYCGDNAMNCTGTSASTGLYAGDNATNCTGNTTGTAGTGLWCVRTATSCYGKHPGGASTATGLKAAIAIGCTYTAGVNGLVVPAGKSFNM